MRSAEQHRQTYSRAHRRDASLPACTHLCVPACCRCAYHLCSTPALRCVAVPHRTHDASHAAADPHFVRSNLQYLATPSTTPHTARYAPAAPLRGRLCCYATTPRLPRYVPHSCAGCERLCTSLLPVGLLSVALPTLSFCRPAGHIPLASYTPLHTTRASFTRTARASLMRGRGCWLRHIMRSNASWRHKHR